MSTAIKQHYTADRTLYAVIRNSSGEVWYPTGQAFETWGTAGRTADDYRIIMTEHNKEYVCDFDTNVDSGRYEVQTFRQVGSSPADSDMLIGAININWSGDNILYE